MNQYQYDKRIVMTLDAGGTNFVFSAMQGGQEIVNPIGLPSNGDNLEKCINTLIIGFKEVKGQLKEQPVAISFAFPGPADYPAGIIGDLNNLPAFRGGVPLGAILENEFNIPVFINNDGDLFAYGEGIAGFLPELNAKLKAADSPKKYRNLVGVTLGTGFGGGLFTNGQLFIGDNSAGAEIWVLRNHKYSKTFIEESASIRAVKRVYAEHAGLDSTELTPREIYDIAEGTIAGNHNAAKLAFEELGQTVGDALADVSCVVDGIIVIGGGLAGANKYFMPALVKKMNESFTSLAGNQVSRLETTVFNLEDPLELDKFIAGKVTRIDVPGSTQKISYDSMKRIGVGISKLGASRAIALGAYCFALQTLK